MLQFLGLREIKTMSYRGRKLKNEITAPLQIRAPFELAPPSRLRKLNKHPGR